MAKVLPFQAIRPKEGLEEQIAELPYDVYSSKEAREVIARRPASFLKIDRAETNFSEEISPYDEVVYQKAHDLLWDMLQKGDFKQDSEKNYYLYELTMNNRVQTGIVACCAIDDYENNRSEERRVGKECRI